MYSWNTIRTFCAILLLIPVIHLVYLVSQDVTASMQASPEAWAGEIAAYSAQDQSATLPVKPILVVGGRQVKLWRGLEDLLSPRPVLMRGLGDAIVEDMTYYHSELIGHYQPGVLVILPGTSEFHIRDNKSAEELVVAIRELVTLDESYKVPRQYYIFAPIKTPLYTEDYVKIDETTALLTQWAQGQPNVTILDANTFLTSRKGKPNPNFFRLDGVNLNEHGYLRISVMLQSKLNEKPAQEYVTLSTF